VLLGVVFLGESLTLSHLGGLAVLLIGLWMITHNAAKLGPRR
jgi:drug/metabolite transporter (DMT)-like permease